MGLEDESDESQVGYNSSPFNDSSMKVTGLLIKDSPEEFEIKHFKNSQYGGSTLSIEERQIRDDIFSGMVLTSVARLVVDPKQTDHTAEQIMSKINLGRKIGKQKFHDSLSKGELSDEFLSRQNERHSSGVVEKAFNYFNSDVKQENSHRKGSLFQPALR